MDDELKPPETEEEQAFEMSPEQATGMDSSSQPGQFNRKRALQALCITAAVVIGGGLLLNTLKPSGKKSSAEQEFYASNNSSNEFLTSLRNRALRNRDRDQTVPGAGQAEAEEGRQNPEPEDEPLLPAVTLNRSPAVESVRGPPQPPPQSPQYQQPPPPQQQYGGQQPENTHFRSSLVPEIQGSLFSRQGQIQSPPAQAQGQSFAADYFSNPPVPRNSSPSSYASDYAAQNNQENKQGFFDPSSGGAVFNGQFLGENSLWVGTVIPAVLETSINTDLPGNVLARVTQNVYDSLTGRRLLVPQGTLLVARYNSSVSYSQHRVQIVWDALIRPDGYHVELEGANGVDAAGMSGQAAQYHENWFEYAKAAGVISMFSYANARLTAAAARYADNETAAGITAGNSGLVNQLGGNIVSRAMNIQPTLTVDNGTRVNIMINKTVYMPPAEGYPANQRYILE
jgi:type IV secretory pathway VirB10-like protein